MYLIIAFSIILELIETYWNVNISPTENKSSSSGELIETYWNVN